MASHASRNDNFMNNHGRTQRSKSRSRSRSRHINTSKLQSNRACSEEGFEKKISNINESNYEIFLSVSQAFESILNQLEIDENSEGVHKKLLEIKKLVKEKISFLEVKINDKNKNISQCSNSLTSSVLSLNFEESAPDNNIDESFLKEFLLKVICPFCSKSQADKINLIKHLDNDCTPHKHKLFSKTHFPYSTFQILPNNAIKCNVCPNTILSNLIKYITHLHTVGHTSAYEKAVRTKFYSEFLYCSSCKVQVANTCTQIDFHMKHEAHKNNKIPNLENYLKKGIHCVYYKSKKFRCLICLSSHSFYETPKEIIKHLEESNHTRNFKKGSNNLFKLYCELCCTEVHVFEILNHFNEKEHKKKVEEGKLLENSYELCIYCGFMCNDLMALSIHMESKCPEMNEMRTKNLESVKIDENNQLKESVKIDKKNKKKKSVRIDENIHQKDKNDEKKEVNYIIVKDTMEIEIPDLFKYFKKFGEITGVKMLNEKSLKINFSEKKTAEDILKLRDVLKINGVNLEISTDENFCKSEEKINQPIVQTKSPDGNDEVGASYKERNRNASSYETDSSDTFTENSEMKYLFQIVSSHLVNNAEKCDNELQKRLIHDCTKALGFEHCDLVGFSKCELSFSVESINLYCDLKRNLQKESQMSFSLLNKTYSSETIMLRSCYHKMCESDLWKNVTVSFDSTLPHIKCEHKETQKTCNINFSQSAFILTKMLRHCLNSNAVVRQLCLIIRFWLSVQELKIREFEFAIISILVFFLISQKIVSLPLEIYSFAKISRIEKALKEKFEIKESPSNWQANKFDIEKLFHNFLLFLSKFEFDKNIICLPIPHPVPKTFFMDNDPSLYDQILKSPICILDLNNKNLGEDIKEEDIKSLLDIANSTIKHYKIK